MNIDFSAGDVTSDKKEFTDKYFTPGVEQVVIKEITHTTPTETGQDGKLKAPFYSVFFTDTTGVKTIENRYYLRIEAPAPGRKSSFNISMSSLKDIGIAAVGLDKYNTIKATSTEELGKKLAAMLVGKPFRMLIKGEEVETKAGKRFIKALATSIVEPKNGTRLVFSDKYITRLPEATTSTDLSLDSVEPTKAKVETTDPWA